MVIIVAINLFTNQEHLFLAHHRLRYRHRAALLFPRRDAPLQEIWQEGREQRNKRVIMTYHI